MSNLVQKTIVDKNGVASKRWVKPDTGSAKSKTIPAPGGRKSKKEQPSPTPYLHKMFMRGPLGHTLIKLDDFDQRTVYGIEALLARTDVEDFTSYTNAMFAVQFALKEISYAEFHGDPDETDEDRQESVRLATAKLNNIAVFADAAFQRGTRAPDFRMLVNGLYQFPDIDDFLLEATDEERERAAALITVTCRIRDIFTVTEYGGPEDDFDAYDENKDPDADLTRIDSDYLSDFIMSRPEDTLKIAAIINERDTDDVNLIRSVLDHGTQSLREGVL